MTGAAGYPGGPGPSGAGQHQAQAQAQHQAQAQAQAQGHGGQPDRMHAVEARRHAVALVRAHLLRDHDAASILLDAIDPFDDPIGQLMTLTSVVELAATALDQLTDRENALSLLDHITQHAPGWSAGAPVPWHDAPSQTATNTDNERS